MYEIVTSDKAKKQLNKFPQDFLCRINSVFERIKINPFHHIKRKEGTKYFILRVGEHRIILDIKNDKKIIYIIELGHRKDIYKK